MMEAVGLVVLFVAALALAVLAEVRSRKLKAVTMDLAVVLTARDGWHERAKEAESEKLGIESLLQKSMTERVELTGRLATADDLKASYEEAALLVLQRMAEARAVLRKPRLKPDVRIQRALAIMEPNA